MILTWRVCEGYVSWVECFGYGILGKTSLDVYVFPELGHGFGFGLQGVFLYCVVGFSPFPILPSLLSCSLLSTGCLGLGGFRAFVCFLFSSTLSSWCVHFDWKALGQRGNVGTGYVPDGLYGLRPKPAGMRPVACSPHWLPPAPML